MTPEEKRDLKLLDRIMELCLEAENGQQVVDFDHLWNHCMEEKKQVMLDIGRRICQEWEGDD